MNGILLTPLDSIALVRPVEKAKRAERLMFGSDYQVCLLVASYEKVSETYLSFLANLKETERNLVLGQNAADFYNS